MTKFSSVSEHQITKAILDDFLSGLSTHLSTEVIVVGGGPSGLVAARELALEGIKVLVIESNNYLGGGFWIGGFLMNGVTIREPAQKVLEELSIPYKPAEEGLYIANGPHACSKLVASTCEAGATILNMVRFEDVVLREKNEVKGVVINWTPVSALPRAITCVDPIALESEMVIDASGHDAVVCSALAKRGLLDLLGYGGMWVERSEELVVEKSGEVHPGLLVTGMAVATVFGIPRMGPTFGAMLLSGKKVAKVAKEILAKKRVGSQVRSDDRLSGRLEEEALAAR